MKASNFLNGFKCGPRLNNLYFLLYTEIPIELMTKPKKRSLLVKNSLFKVEKKFFSLYVCKIV